MKKITNLKINELALDIVKKIISNKELYGAEVNTLSNGSTVSFNHSSTALTFKSITSSTAFVILLMV